MPKCLVAKARPDPDFRVLLETRGLFLGWKLQRHNHRPWSVRLRVPARTMVVPCESRAQIIGDPDVVSGRVYVTANDVNDAFLDAVHADG